MALSASAVKRAKWTGHIKLNGVPVHTDARVRAGDLLIVESVTENPTYIPAPYPIPLHVPYQDEHLMVVDKTAGIACQASRNHPDDSLENAVYSWSGCPKDFVYRPVNRLDKGTGGLMVIARSAYSQHMLQQKLHSTDFRRWYLALTEGTPPEERGVIDMPIAKMPGATIRRQITPEGKPARTRYRILNILDRKALILLELETGRTHQIRTHLSALGCPIAGDYLYGQEDPDQFPGCFALHSTVLRLIHPVTGKKICLVSLPTWASMFLSDEDILKLSDSMF